MILDVAVIGSGPAGSAVAVHCRKAGLRAAIFTFPGRRRSTNIPETLPVAARPLLESLGVAEACTRFGLRQQYAMSSAWGNDSLTTRHSICNPSGPGWFVDRPLFDREIAREAAKDGVVPVIPAHNVSASRERNDWVLRFRMPDRSEPVAVKAAAVVDATGRASAFASRIGVRRVAFDRLVSVSARAIPGGGMAGEALVESAPDGWWFSALTARGELSVSWFTGGDLLRASDRSISVLERRLQATKHTASRVAALLPQACECRSARTDRLETFAGDGWIAVGDASIACDPLGSQGLLQALITAELASEILVRFGTYNAKNSRNFCEFQINYLERFLRDRHIFYSMERRWPDNPFWHRVNQSPIVPGHIHL